MDGIPADRTPITTCVRCGKFTEDPTRDMAGEPLPEYLLDENDREAVCQDCKMKQISEALETDMLGFLEERLGLAEKVRNAPRAFIETIFTDPEKILKLERLNSRVQNLERDLNTWKWVAGLFTGIALSALGLAATALVGS